MAMQPMPPEGAPQEGPPQEGGEEQNPITKVLEILQIVVSKMPPQMVEEFKAKVDEIFAGAGQEGMEPPVDANTQGNPDAVPVR